MDIRIFFEWRPSTNNARASAAVFLAVAPIFSAWQLKINIQASFIYENVTVVFIALFVTFLLAHSSNKPHRRAKQA